MVRVERGVLVLGRAARRAGGRDIGVYMTTEGVSAPRTRGMGWQGARLGPDRWGGPERCICWGMPVGLDLSPAGRLNAGEGGPEQQWTKSRNKGLLVVVCVCVGRLNHQPKVQLPGGYRRALCCTGIVERAGRNTEIEFRRPDASVVGGAAIFTSGSFGRGTRGREREPTAGSPFPAGPCQPLNTNGFHFRSIAFPSPFHLGLGSAEQARTGGARPDRSCRGRGSAAGNSGTCVKSCGKGSGIGEAPHPLRESFPRQPAPKVPPSTV